MARLDTPIPRRMRALQKDPRGYPVPFNVLRDKDGKPHFTINDEETRIRCIKEGRCAICGNRLRGLRWFVGGPMSAFLPEGAYIDTALHSDCCTYAMMVCPYLAAPNYLGRIDDATLDHSKLPDHVATIIDPTLIPARPRPFVVIGATGYDAWRGEGGIRVKPVRPYKAVEYWIDGVKISEQQARPLVDAELAKAKDPAFLLSLPRWP